MAAAVLAHLPSGKFTANAAWLAIAAIACNLLRAVGALTGHRHATARAATIRRDLIASPGAPPATAGAASPCTCLSAGPASASG